MKIPLTQGKFTLVDDEDYDYLNQWKWYYHEGYAVRMAPRPERQRIHMHRVILERMGFKDFGDSDHINRSRADNRRHNLRPATRRQNQCNQSKRYDNTSGYTGVYWERQRRKWRVQLGLNGRTKHIGRFDDKKEAARAYDMAAIIHHGEFAQLNFPCSDYLIKCNTKLEPIAVKVRT
jgi:hypothetical protein